MRKRLRPKIEPPQRNTHSDTPTSSRPLRQKTTLWILLSCVVAQLFLIGQENYLVIQTVGKVTAIRLNDAPSHEAELPVGTREQHLILPAGSMDARWWTLYAEQMLREHRLRIRHTSLDNAPEGRDVHWSSLLTWLLAGGAFVRSLFIAGSLPEHVSQVALHLSPWLGLLLLGTLIFLIRRHAGSLVALVFANAALASPAIVRAFEVGEADHHGLVLVFASGSLIFLWLALSAPQRHAKHSGKTFRQKSLESVDTLARVAGVLAAAGLWISAATTIPILSGSAFGMLLAGWILRTVPEKQRPLLPRVIVVWSGWGAAASLGFYLLEYFPSHMGWRLEVNHPLYALSLFAGGRLLALFVTLLTRESRQKINVPLTATMLLALSLTPLLVILMFQKNVFWVADPFLHALHKEFIHEFQNILKLIQTEGFDLGYPAAHLWPISGLLCAPIVLTIGHLPPDKKVSLLIALTSALLMQGLAFYQIRWSSSAQGLWIVVATICFASGFQSERRKIFLFTALVLSILSLFLIRIPSLLVTSVREEQAVVPPIPQEHGNSIILRDIAHRLIHATPGKIPLVLSGPNSSSELAYYGLIRTLGTLYWENMPGIKRAAHLFTEPDEKKVLSELQATGVTHILVPSWDNFSEAYIKLLEMEKGQALKSEPFLNKVCKGEITPDWLRPFAYPIPSGSGLDTRSVRIFAVLPEQNPFEVWFYRGIYHFESAEKELAWEAFLKADSLRPGEPRVRDYLRQLDSDHTRPIE